VPVSDITDILISENENGGCMTTLRQAAENFLNSYLALVNSGDCGNWDPETEAEVIALRQALAECRSIELQEPVVINPLTQWVEYLKRLSDHGKHRKIPSGLSAGVCYDLAIEIEQFIKIASPRQWVGLTKDEVNSWELPDCPTVFEFAQFIEAKLKEKNT
jgi:hypothetical protein